MKTAEQRTRDLVAAAQLDIMQIDPQIDRQAQSIALTGLTMRQVRKLNAQGRPGAADLVAAGYDYRARGQTYQQALGIIRELCAGFNRPANQAACYAYNHRGCPSKWAGAPWDVEVYRNSGREYGNLSDTQWTRNKYAAQAGQRRRNREEAIKRAQHLAAVVVAPADWLTHTLTWDHPRMDLVLSDGRRISTTRRESATWDRSGKSRWPSSTSTDYRTRFVRPDGEDTPDARSVTHDARGNWRHRVLREMGLAPANSQTDMHLRLNPCCTTREGHSLPDGTRIGERLLCGVRVDYYARTEDSKTAFHASTVTEAVAGIQRKLRHAKSARRGELLTAQTAHTRWGFCLPGLREFADACGLDINGEYDIDEVRQAVTPDIRARFEKDLVVAGI